LKKRRGNKRWKFSRRGEEIKEYKAERKEKPVVGDVEMK
jgi:hypothetical protein